VRANHLLVDAAARRGRPHGLLHGPTKWYSNSERSGPFNFSVASEVAAEFLAQVRDFVPALLAPDRLTCKTGGDGKPMTVRDWMFYLQVCTSFPCLPLFCCLFVGLRLCHLSTAGNDMNSIVGVRFSFNKLIQIAKYTTISCSAELCLQPILFFLFILVCPFRGQKLNESNFSIINYTQKSGRKVGKMRYIF
jgi:hypothetical protein